MLNSPVFSATINLSVAAYMIYCRVSSRLVLCRIAASLLIVNALMGFLFFAGLDFTVLQVIFGFVLYFYPLAMAVFAIQLLITAAKIKPAGEGWENYNYIFAISLLLIAAFFIPFLYNFSESKYCEHLYIRHWPELAFVLTFVVMRIKRVTINKDENKLLWYFAVSILLSAILFFCRLLSIQSRIF